MKSIKFFLTIGLALMLAACAMPVKTEVDAYSKIPADLNPKTIYITPFKGINAQDIEWQTNAQTLASVLSEKGFEVVGRQRDARITAYFGFSVDKGERVQSSYSIPQYGVTGYSGANTFGTIYGNSFSSTTSFTPTYGVTGYSSGTITREIFTRVVAIDMVDNKTRQQVFKARGVSRGRCNSIAPVAVSIIKAILSDFPGGRTGTVFTDMENKC